MKTAALFILSACLVGCVVSQPMGASPEVESLPTLGQVILSNPTGQLGNMAAALQAGGLLTVLNDPSANFTVFAPQDSGFSTATSQAGASGPQVLLGLPQVLTPLLQYHVVKGAYFSNQLQDGMELETLNDDKKIKVKVENGQTTLEGEEGEPAMIVVPDLLASNGVIHVINNVLLAEKLNLGGGK